MELSYNKNISLERFNTLEEVAEKTINSIKIGNIALSGGSTYLSLLKLWAKKNLDLTNVNFYPVDERVVDFNSQYSNWGNSYRDFLSKYSKNREHHFIDSQEYNNFLKDIKMDTIFLGVGDDGHTASLFNIDDVFKYPERRSISTISPKEPRERVSLTGDYIIQADRIIIIFYGAGKEGIVKKVIDREPLPITKLLERVNNGVIYIHKDLIKE